MTEVVNNVVIIRRIDKGCQYVPGLPIIGFYARVGDSYSSWDLPVMKPPKRWSEVFVEKEFLTVRSDLIRAVIKIDDNTYKVVMEHPVFGTTIEIFELDESDNTLCLKSIFPAEMQSEEELDIAKDYYNGFLLEGSETYLEYYNPAVGYYLLSRNIGVYPTNVYKVEEEESE